MGVAFLALRFRLQLVAVADDDEQVFIDDIAVLDKDYERLEPLGLSLAEAKALLLELQRLVPADRSRRSWLRAWRAQLVAGRMASRIRRRLPSSSAERPFWEGWHKASIRIGRDDL